MALPKDVVIFIDSREKRPLQFPTTVVIRNPDYPDRRDTYRIHTEVRELKTGDYALAGYETARLIERKGGAREVIQNVLTGDIRRFSAAMDRLALACSLPLVFLEGNVSEILQEGPWCKDPTGALDTLMWMADSRKVGLEIVPCATILQRRSAGEWVVRRLLNAAVVAERGYVPWPPIDLSRPGPSTLGSKPPQSCSDSLGSSTPPVEKTKV